MKCLVCGSESRLKFCSTTCALKRPDLLEAIAVEGQIIEEQENEEKRKTK